MTDNQPRVLTWGRLHRQIAAIAGCLAIGLMVTASLMLAPASRADVIEGAITSITTTATHVDQWDQVAFGCTWAIPDGSKPGDTFSLDLPPELKWFGSKTFALLAPDGSVVANATADDSGHVVFTMADYVASHPVDVHGTCSFTTQYTAVTTGEEVDLVFEVDSGVLTVPVDTNEPCTVNCAPARDEAGKDMWWIDGDQQSTRSVIWAPATTTDASTVTLTDVPGPGLSIDCTSLVAHIGTHVDAEGRLAAPFDDATLPAAVDCTPTRLAVTWSNVPKGEYTEIRATSIVTDPSRTEYTNRATVKINGVNTPVDSTVRRTDGDGTGEGTPTTSPSTRTTTTTTTTSPPTTTTSTSPSTTTTSSSSTTTTYPSTTTSTTGTLPFTDTDTGSGTASDSGSGAGPSQGSLAFTGTEVRGLALTGAALIAMGLLLSLALRRRRH
jgi:hypothetical protein